jgi:hypothetical protein
LALLGYVLPTRDRGKNKSWPQNMHRIDADDAQR